MNLIVGLGNPGRNYACTRHNIGSLIVKEFAQGCKTELKDDKYTFSANAKVKIKDREVVLAIPLSYMNLSGGPVSSLLKKYKIDPENLLVVCDDLDLELGRFKIRPSGSSGGHHGLESIIDSLNSRDFARLRIGIDRPKKKGIEIPDYVLSSFSNKEKASLENVIAEACSCCKVWVSEGITKSMNMFNKKNNLTMKGSKQ